MAGAGLMPDFSYGESDKIGWTATSKALSWHHCHATVFDRLVITFGFDQERLMSYQNGIQHRLTNVHGVAAD